jgi:hypothetical protein
MYFFREFAIGCAIAAAISVTFLVGDKITHQSFTQGWLLFSSLFWMAVSGAIYWRLKKKRPRT